MTPTPFHNPGYLPREQRNLLFFSVRTANGLASAGQVMQGYRLLQHSLETAAKPVCAKERWGPLLVQCYQHALAAFTRRHGVQLIL